MARDFNVREIMRQLDKQITLDNRALGRAIIGPLVLFTPVGMPGTWKSPPPPGYQPGHARFSWKTSIGTGQSGDTAGIDPGGAATIARGLSVINRAKFTDRIVFQNNAKYIGALEENHSPQTGGAGIVERAVRGGIAATAGGRKELE